MSSSTPCPLRFSVVRNCPTANRSVRKPTLRVIKSWYCQIVVTNTPRIKDTPINCTNNNPRFHERLLSVYLRKICVTGILANILPGRTPATKNNRSTVRPGTHRFCQVKSSARRTCNISSIPSRKIYINTRQAIIEVATSIPVSHMNIPNTCVPSAPQHLCTPTALARRLNEATAAST